MEDFLAIPNLESVYDQYPDSIIFAFLASRYLEEGMPEKALPIAERGVQKHPAYGFGHFVLGLCYYQLADLENAKKHLEVSVACDDKNPRAWKLIGEINEKFSQPIKAADSNLQYYLLDSFNKDAVDKFQQEEMQQFDEFESDQALELESELSEEETFMADEDFDLPSDETAIDDLFENEGPEAEELDISRKVDEVFKETLGDFTFEREESKAAETPLSEDVLKDFDEFEVKEPQPEPPQAPPKGKETPAAEAGGDFDDFYTLPGIEEEFPQPRETSEDEPLDLDKLLSEIIEEPGEEAPQTPDNPEILNYRSIVDQILAEPEPESSPGEEQGASTSPEKPEPELPSPEEKMSAAVTLPRPRPVPPAPSRSDGATRFSRPPILSPTLGEIYISQGRFEEALDVFRQLLEKDPANQRFQKKINDIRMMMDRQGSQQ